MAAVAAGAYHSVALTKDGRVVTFGAAQLGQLGRSPDGGGVDKAGLPVDARPRPVEGLDEGALQAKLASMRRKPRKGLAVPLKDAPEAAVEDEEEVAGAAAGFGTT